MRRDLQPLFAPRSVAILGASNDPAKWGNWLARGAMRGAHRRPVYLVNRNGGEVLGERAYASLGELPEAPVGPWMKNCGPVATTPTPLSLVPALTIGGLQPLTPQISNRPSF